MNLGERTLQRKRWLLVALAGERPTAYELVPRSLDRLELRADFQPGDTSLFDFDANRPGVLRTAVPLAPERIDWRWQRSDGTAGRSKVVRAETRAEALGKWLS